MIPMMMIFLVTRVTFRINIWIIFHPIFYCQWYLKICVEILIILKKNEKNVNGTIDLVSPSNDVMTTSVIGDICARIGCRSKEEFKIQVGIITMKKKLDIFEIVINCMFPAYNCSVYSVRIWRSKIWMALEYVNDHIQDLDTLWKGNKLATSKVVGTKLKQMFSNHGWVYTLNNIHNDV